MTDEKEDSSTPQPGKDEDFVRDWLKTLAKSEKAEKEWRKEAGKIARLYEGDDGEESPYNILYSNTETLSPALYNTIPRPEVRPRYKDKDLLARASSKVGQRLLEFLLDPGKTDETTFDGLIKANVLDSLVPGRGVCRFRYDSKVEEFEAPEEPGPDGLPQAAPPPSVSDEEVCGEAVDWDCVLFGYARSWAKVPWAAYKHEMTREELEENFGAVGKKVPVTESKEDDDSSRESMLSSGRSKEADGVKLATVWEIWDKASRKVFFLAPAYKDGMLKEVEDPFNLQGFFPSPEPLRFFARVKGMVPVPLYELYRDQAEELNIVTRRIKHIVKALKVRGFYDAQIADLAKLLESADNTMLPAENLKALFGQGQTASDAVWILPLTDLISALQQLYNQRQQIKSIIFELTGIADIMRGSSQASETLGAQEIKNQWGTLRLKRMQKEVARYCRDCLRIMLELGVNKFQQETIRKMTGLAYPTAQEKQQAQEQWSMMQQQAATAPQAMPAPGQPPAPPQPPPEMPPQLAKAINSPTWEELLGLLKDDVLRNFRIDIETNSTVDAEATEDKTNISELLAVMSQFLLGMGPMVKDGTMPFEVAKEILSFILRRYRFGEDVDEALQGMQPPKPEDDGSAQKGQLEQQKLEGQSKLAQEKHQMEMAALKAKSESEARLMQMEERKMQLELQIAEREAQLKEAESGRKMQLAEAQHQQKMQQAMLPPQPVAAARPAPGKAR